MKPTITLVLLLMCVLCLGQHFEEDFTTFPGDWTIQSGPSSTASGVALWHAADSSAAIEKIDDFVVHDEWLISPSFYIPTSPRTILQFDFKACNFWMITPFDSADVTLNITTDSGVTWTPIWNEDTIHFDSYQWTTDYVDLTSFQNDSIQIGIRYQGRKGDAVHFDNIMVRDAPRHDLVVEDLVWFMNGNIDTVQYYTVQDASTTYSTMVLVRNLGWDQTTPATLEFTPPGFGTTESIPGLIIQDREWVTLANTWSPISGTLYLEAEIRSDSTDAFPSNNLLQDTINTNWSGHKQMKELLGFVPIVDLDEDGITDAYEIRSLYQPDHGNWYTPGTIICNIARGESFGAPGPWSGEIYGNIHALEHDTSFYAFDGLSAPIPHAYIDPSDTSSINNPRDFELWFYDCPYISDGYLLENRFEVVAGFNIDYGRIGFGQTARFPANKIVFYGTTVGGPQEFILRECPAVWPELCYGGHEELESTLHVTLLDHPWKGIGQMELDVQSAGEVKCDLKSLNGQLIATRNLGELNPGKHHLSFDLSALSAGSYLYTVYVEEASVSGKITVIR